MTELERYALQTGKQTPHIPGAETALDRYIMAKIDRDRVIISKENFDNVMEAAATNLAETACKALNKAFTIKV